MTIKIFPQLYVGLKDQSQTSSPLGFAAPYENNAASRKRQETIDGWCGVRYGKPNPHAKIIDNALVDGFEVTDDIKRIYWGGGNVVWRVLDPRGFELEISSANLMALLKTTTLNQGRIEGKCIWGRDGATNVLLHADSEPYQESLKSYSTANEKTAAGIAPGTRVTVRNGDSLIYLGRHLVTYVETHYQPRNYHEREREKHLWYRRLEVMTETPAVITAEIVRQQLVQPAAFDLLYNTNLKKIIAYAKVKVVIVGDVELSKAQIDEALKADILWAASGTYSRLGERIVTAKKLKLVMQPATDITPLLYESADRYYRHPTALHEVKGIPMFVLEHEGHLLNLSVPCTENRYGYGSKGGGTLLLPFEMDQREIVQYSVDLTKVTKGGSGGPSLYLPPFTSIEQRDAWIKLQHKHDRIKVITYGEDTA